MPVELAAYELEELPAVDLGHDQVGEEDVVGPIIQPGDALLAVVRLAHPVPALFKDSGQELDEEEVAVDN